MVKVHLRRMAAGLVATGALLGLMPSMQAGEKITLETSVDWLSHYVWRGMLLTDEPVLQPSVTVSMGDLSLNVWGNIDTTDINEAGEDDFRLQEVDYSLSYAMSPMEGVDLEAGFLWYTYSSCESTGEVYGGVTFPCMILSPSLTAYYDVDEADGWYLNAGVEHAFAMTERLSLILSGGLGWGTNNYHEYYYGERAHSSESDMLVQATLEYAMTDYLTLRAYTGYTELLDGDVERLGRQAYGDSDVLFGGLGMSFTF